MTRKGVWDIQDVRDKLLSGDPWLRYNAMYTSGVNVYGELGQGNQDGSGEGAKFAQVDSQEDFSQVGGCDEASFGVTADGKLMCMGNNPGGVLGLNQPTSSRYSSPTQVPGTTWASTCMSHTGSMMGAKTDGTAWFWGRSPSSVPQGRLRGVAGYPANQSCSSPVQIPGTSYVANPSRTDQQKFMFTERAGYLIDGDDKLYSWGFQQWGELGQNQGGDVSSAVAYKTQVGTDTTWKWVSGYTGPTQVSCASAVKTDGTLWALGGAGGPDGCMGLGNNKTDISSPTQVGANTNWASISGANMGDKGGFCAMKDDGTLWVWGMTGTGTLGLNQTNVSISSPYSVPGGPWKFGQVCENTMIRLKADDTLWISGDVRAAGMQGETGHQLISSPVQVPSATVGFSSEMGIWGASGYLNCGVISPNLTPAQV
tara:strand:- start:2927 stop:4204 length:1278 start_codon:yes stop_codon:yes gene_type:complete